MQRAGSRQMSGAVGRGDGRNGSAGGPVSCSPEVLHLRSYERLLERVTVITSEGPCLMGVLPVNDKLQKETQKIIDSIS